MLVRTLAHSHLVMAVFKNLNIFNIFLKFKYILEINLTKLMSLFLNNFKVMDIQYAWREYCKIHAQEL